MGDIGLRGFGLTRERGYKVYLVGKVIPVRMYPSAVGSRSRCEACEVTIFSTMVY